MLAGAVSDSWLVVATWAVALLGLGAAAGWFTARLLRDRGRPTPGTALPTPKPVAVPLDVVVQPSFAEPRVDALVEGLIGAYDLAGANEAVRRHVEQVLRSGGVVPVLAEAGAAFDSSAHDAVDTEPAGAEHPPQTVARLVRPGWIRDTTLIRAAEVVVWT